MSEISKMKNAVSNSLFSQGLMILLVMIRHFASLINKIKLRLRCLKKITGTFGFFLQPRWDGQNPVDLLRMLIKKGQAGSPVTGWLMTHH